MIAASTGASWWNPMSWDERLVAPGPPRTLVAMRTLLTVVIGARLLLRRWWVVAERPEELFDPVAALSWLPGQPGAAVVTAVWVLGLAAVGLTLWNTATGRRAATSFVIAWASLLFLAGLWGSAGKVMHNDVLLVTVAVPLLFAGSPELHPRDRTSGWAPRAALVTLAVVYFLTGYQKLRHTGISWAFSDNMSWVIRQGSSPFGEAFGRSIAQHAWLTQAMAAGALALELAAPVLLAVRRLRVWFALGATVMHTSIWMFLGLDYYGWVLTVWAVVLPMSPLADRWWHARAGSGPAPAATAASHG